MDMRGRTVVVTGASSGLGLASSVALARAGAEVVMACRSADKAAEALVQVKSEAPSAAVSTVLLDLADLDSVRRCGEELAVRPVIDVLLNNAGVMMPPVRRTTSDGFELQMGTNHLGHFALTGLLLPRLLQTPGSRVVTVSSIAARRGRIDLDDLMSERSYAPSPSYGASKLANLLFTLELQRRLSAAGAGTISVAAHPGVSSTNLMSSMQLNGVVTRLASLLMQGAEAGARPQVHAATAADVAGGDYFGPKGPGELRGRTVTRAALPPAAQETAVARALWARSEELTGVAYPSRPS